jgi:hypothetical protein
VKYRRKETTRKMIILKCILEKQDRIGWTGLMRLRMWISGGLLMNPRILQRG